MGDAIYGWPLKHYNEQWEGTLYYVLLADDFIHIDLQKQSKVHVNVITINDYK